jgi:hypothetical protein
MLAAQRPGSRSDFFREKLRLSSSLPYIATLRNRNRPRARTRPRFLRPGTTRLPPFPASSLPANALTNKSMTEDDHEDDQQSMHSKEDRNPDGDSAKDRTEGPKFGTRIRPIEISAPQDQDPWFFTTLWSSTLCGANR